MNKKDGVGRGLVDNKAKGPGDYKPLFLVGDTISNGVVGGFSWPPRSYTCSFCKREFRSAQALGGHMNVHRRDRARLRESPPWVAQSSNPNPNSDNQNPNSSTSNPAKLPPLTCAFPTLNSSSSSSSSSSHACFASPSLLSSPSTNKSRISELAASSTDPLLSKDDVLRRKKTLKELLNVGTLKDLVVEKDRDGILRKRDIVSLDLEIGLHGDSKDDLDLELRLGYA